MLHTLYVILYSKTVILEIFSYFLCIVGYAFWKHCFYRVHPEIECDPTGGSNHPGRNPGIKIVNQQSINHFSTVLRHSSPTSSKHSIYCRKQIACKIQSSILKVLLQLQTPDFAHSRYMFLFHSHFAGGYCLSSARMGLRGDGQTKLGNWKLENEVIIAANEVLERKSQPAEKMYQEIVIT